MTVPGRLARFLISFIVYPLFYSTTMPKRSSEAAELAQTGAKSQDVGQNTARAETVNEDDEMGEFEDRWEDELESDGEVVDAGEDQDGDDDDVGECKEFPRSIKKFIFSF